MTLTSGIIGSRPAPGSAVAAAGAAAIEGLVCGLAVEIAPLRVNTVRPGVVGTPEPAREQAFQALTARTLTGAVGTAEQLGSAHVFLMENAFISGTVLTANGGALLAG